VPVSDMKWSPSFENKMLHIRDNGTHSTKVVEGTFACLGIFLLILRNICLQNESSNFKNDFGEKYRARQDANRKKSRYNFVGFL